jgi:hypothetical protein
MNRQFSLLAALGLFVACPASAPAQTIIADSFDVTGGISPGTGFGPDDAAAGVNYEISQRLSGTAESPAMQYIRTAGGKAESSASIFNNALQVADAANTFSFQLTEDGFTAFNFGAFLAGAQYEINLIVDLDEMEAVNRRMSFFLADAPAPVAGVGDADLGFQLATNGSTAAGPMQIFKRIDGASNIGGADINTSVLTGLPFGAPVALRFVVSDSLDFTQFASSYELFVNGVSTDSGNFRFNDTDRYLIFDVAPAAGPATFDSFSVRTIPEPGVGLLLGTSSLLWVGGRRRAGAFRGKVSPVN